MIIVALFTAVLTVLTTFITVVVPEFDAIGDLFDYFNLIVDKGLDIYRFFVPPYGQLVFSIILEINAFYFVYKVIMWFVTKIPMGSIGDNSN